MNKTKIWLGTLLAIMMGIVFLPATSLAAEEDNYNYVDNIEVGQTVDVTSSEDEVYYKVITPSQDIMVKLKITCKKGDVEADLENLTEGDYITYSAYESDSPEFARVGAAVLEAGKEYAILVSNYNATGVQLSLTVSDIRSISYQPKGVLYENLYGSLEDAYDDDGEPIPGQKYFHYTFDEDSFTEGDILAITDKDGNTKTYTAENVIDKYGYPAVSFVAGDGSSIDANRIALSDNQEETHWTLGSNNEATLTYEGVPCKFNVTIAKNPVTSVKYTPAQEYRTFDSQYYSDLYGETGGYEEPEPNIGDRMTVSFNDGRANETYVYQEVNDGCYWSLEGETKRTRNQRYIAADSDQKTETWVFESGKNYDFYFTYLGVRSNPLQTKMSLDIGEAGYILSADTYTYDGKEKKPAIKSVIYEDQTLVEGKDFEIDNPDYGGTKVGTYIVGIKGKGIYGRSNYAAFTIAPKATSITKVKKGKKSFTVKWKRDSKTYPVSWTNKKLHTGYVVEYSLKKNFSGASRKFVSSYKKNSLTVKKLKAGKKYYVRVCSYCGKGEDFVNSKWSKTKTIKTK